jgi:hypothetical protein
VNRKYLCFLLVVTFVITTCIGVNAATLYVPSQYVTIQEGIDAAVNADTVLVADGIYTGEGNKNLDFGGKAITVQSENGPEKTIIDCEGTGRGYYFHSGEHSSSVIRGFTIKNGLVLGNYPNTANGGGIYCTDNSSPTITNNIITNNQADRGGGIGCINSSPIIINNTIIQNSAKELGGGIDCDENSFPVINNNLIKANSVEGDGGIGGGVCVSDYDYSPDHIFTLAQNNITENEADFGGGVGCIYSFINLTDNTITGNSAKFGGGISCVYSVVTITNNIIAKNSSSFIGGGIYSIWNSSLIVTNNTITENQANFGGGVYCDSYCAMKILNTILWANNAYIDGHQIYVGLPSNGLEINYSDIQGGKGDIVNNENTVNWGEGNINIHPFFVDSYNEDYHLQADSPCKDAGDLKSKKEPDGTRADIGVFYYDPNVIPVATKLTKISGDKQNSAVGTVIADPLVVQILDQNGVPMEGVAVNFDSNRDAIVNPIQTTTNKNGQAQTVLTLGVQEGIYSVTAQALGLEPVIFTATALASDLGYPIRRTINLHEGINLISIPLKFETTWRMSDMIRHIGENDVNMIIHYDTEEEKFVSYMIRFGEDAKSNVPVECDEGYIVVMKIAKQVVFEGYPCEDEAILAPKNFSSDTFAKPIMPPILSNNDQNISIQTFSFSFDKLRTGSKRKSLFVLTGIVMNDETGKALNGALVTVRNLRTGQTLQDKSGEWANSGQYVITFVAPSADMMISAGDILEITLPYRLTMPPMTYSLTDAEISECGLSVPPLRLQPIPSQSALLPNYPNPFNPETWIPFKLAQDANVVIYIYTMKGQHVRTLDIGYRRAGIYIEKNKAAYWDGRDDTGDKVASGVYFYTLQTGIFKATRRMVIMK